MSDRALEVEIYYFFQTIWNKYDSYTSSNIIQFIANLSKETQCTVDSVVFLWQQLMTHRDITLIPGEYESVYFLKQNGHSVRNIYKLTGVTQKKQERILDDITRNKLETPSERGHIKNILNENGELSIDYHACIKGFLDAYKEIKELW